MIGNFIFFVLIGMVFITLNDLKESNALKGQWFLLGCFCYIILHEITHLIFMKIFSKEIAGEYLKGNPNNPYGIMQNEIGIVQIVIAYHVVNEDIVGQVDDNMLQFLLVYGENFIAIVVI